MANDKSVAARIFSTDTGLLVLRLMLFGVFLHHGGQKMLGWFGGGGWDATIRGFADKQGIPPALGAAAIITEFVGAWCLLVGLLARFWAAGLVILMGVAVFYVHLHLKGDAIGDLEFQFSLLAAALAVFLAGPGRWAIADLEGYLLGVRGKGAA